MCRQYYGSNELVKKAANRPRPPMETIIHVSSFNTEILKSTTIKPKTIQQHKAKLHQITQSDNTNKNPNRKIN